MSPELRAKFAAFTARNNVRVAEVEAKKQQIQTLTKTKLTPQEEALARSMRQRHLLDHLGELTGEIDQDEMLLAQLRDDLSWDTIAIVVVGQYQVCSFCHRKCSATSGFFAREQHKRIPSAKRLRRLVAPPMDSELPIELTVEGVVLPRCIECTNVDNRTIVDDLLTAAMKDCGPTFTNQLKLPGVY